MHLSPCLHLTVGIAWSVGNSRSWDEGMIVCGWCHESVESPHAFPCLNIGLFYHRANCAFCFGPCWVILNAGILHNGMYWQLFFNYFASFIPQMFWNSFTTKEYLVKGKEILVMEVTYSGHTNSWISSIPYLLICLSICLSTYPATHPSPCLPIYLSTYQATLE